MLAPELILHDDSIGKGDSLQKGPQSTINSSLDKHRAESGPTHEYKTRELDGFEAVPIPAKHECLWKIIQEGFKYDGWDQGLHW
jgi:hypothetical protein